MIIKVNVTIVSDQVTVEGVMFLTPEALVREQSVSSVTRVTELTALHCSHLDLKVNVGKHRNNILMWEQTQKTKLCNDNTVHMINITLITLVNRYHCYSTI